MSLVHAINVVMAFFILLLSVSGLLVAGMSLGEVQKESYLNMQIFKISKHVTVHSALGITYCILLKYFFC